MGTTALEGASIQGSGYTYRGDGSTHPDRLMPCETHNIVICNKKKVLIQSRSRFLRGRQKPRGPHGSWHPAVAMI